MSLSCCVTCSEVTGPGSGHSGSARPRLRGSARVCIVVHSCDRRAELAGLELPDTGVGRPVADLGEAHEIRYHQVVLLSVAGLGRGRSFVVVAGGPPQPAVDLGTGRRCRAETAGYAPTRATGDRSVEQLCAVVTLVGGRRRVPAVDVLGVHRRSCQRHRQRLVSAAVFAQEQIVEQLAGLSAPHRSGRVRGRGPAAPGSAGRAVDRADDAHPRLLPKVGCGDSTPGNRVGARRPAWVFSRRHPHPRDQPSPP